MVDEVGAMFGGKGMICYSVFDPPIDVSVLIVVIFLGIWCPSDTPSSHYNC